MIQLLLLFPLFAIAHDTGASIAIDIQNVQPKIIGGRYAVLSEIPYQVSLQNIKSGQHFCGGSIISERYVLTAAHCIVGKNIINLSINVGLIDIREPHSVHLIESSYVHEGYDYRNELINDIALLKVKIPFVFSNLISPVTLPKQNQTVPAGSKAVVSEFGVITKNRQKTNRLYITKLQISNQTYCRNIYADPYWANVYDTQICANDPFAEKGSCYGDSGSPLTVNGELVGIVSWAADCAYQQYPTVFTRVPSYINWINKHTK